MTAVQARPKGTPHADTRDRTGTAVVVLITAGPLTGIAHARADRDCADFVYQEDAQAVFDLDRTDPDRLDEDQGPDDGIACEVLPRRSSTVVSVATAVPTLGVQGGTGAAWARPVSSARSAWR